MRRTQHWHRGYWQVTGRLQNGRFPVTVQPSSLSLSWLTPGLLASLQLLLLCRLTSCLHPSRLATSLEASCQFLLLRQLEFGLQAPCRLQSLRAQFLFPAQPTSGQTLLTSPQETPLPCPVKLPERAVWFPIGGPVTPALGSLSVAWPTPATDLLPLQESTIQQFPELQESLAQSPVPPELQQSPEMQQPTPEPMLHQSSSVPAPAELQP